MRYVALVFWIIVIFIGVSFALLNSSIVPINYYIASVKIYLPLLMLMILVIGFLLGAIVMLPALLKTKKKNRKLSKKIKRFEQEVKNLRTIPIKDSH